MSRSCDAHVRFAAGCTGCQAAERRRRRIDRDTARAAVSAPRTRRADVRAQLARWDDWFNVGAATGPSATEARP